MRNYNCMREMLLFIAKEPCDIEFDTFRVLNFERKYLVNELKRLKKENLIDSTLEFKGEVVLDGGRVQGLTDEGVEFVRLIENESVWGICNKTLWNADVDVSYPLLKRVCETIFEQYVISFIPKEI